jgi:hypothetical protein
MAVASLARMSDGTDINRSAVLASDGFRFGFDSHFGAVPSVTYENQELVNSLPSGVTAFYQAGGKNHSQRSPNGFDENRIARFGDAATQPYSYYARETIYQPPTGQNPNATYAVSGFAPVTWTSWQSSEDSIPLNPGKADHGWVTKYHLLGNADSGQFEGAGVPIFFQGSAADSSGILMIGNARPDVAAADWNDRLAEFGDGRFAAKVRVSLSEATDPGAFAGLLFRRQVPTGRAAGANATRTSAAAFAAPGYSANVNRDGVIALQRSNGAGGLPENLWVSDPILEIRNAVRSAAGVELELRTDNNNPKDVQFFVNGVLRHTLRDESPILGPHFGLFAATTSGKIKFSHRTVYDVGLEYTAKYTARTDGTIESDISIQNAAGVLAPHDLSFTNLPVAFLTGQISDPPNRAAEAINQRGNVTNGANEIVPVLRPDGTDYALWVGRAERTSGLFNIPVLAEINGQPASEAHALIAKTSATGDPVIALNALPGSAFNGSPVSLNSVRLVSLWSATVPQAAIAGTVFEDFDGDGTRDADDRGIGQIAVYVDVNNNGRRDDREPTTLSQPSGNYRFAHRLPGSYIVRAQLNTDWHGTFPTAGVYDVQLSSGQSVGGRDFGFYRPSIISGRIFADANADGIADPTEKSVSGITVYIDSNQNSRIDAGEPVRTSDANGRYSFPDLAPGTYDVRIIRRAFGRITRPEQVFYRPLVLSGQQFTDLDFGVERPWVVGRHIFYNQSRFDGNRASIDPADDQAIAPDKSALVPRQQATFGNYTNFSRGINGIMIDIIDMPGTPTLDDFEFRIGNGKYEKDWRIAPAPAAMDIRRGEGVEGSDRIVMVWPDGAIRNQWLMVKVLATSRTGLASPDVHFWGNAVGEVGNQADSTVIDALDQAAIKSNFTDNTDPSNRYDINRDGTVNATDVALAQTVNPPLLLLDTRGDLNSDGFMNAADIDRMFSAIRNQNTEPRYDLNSDDVISWSDAIELVKNVLCTYFGDANVDGVFDSSDLVLIFQCGEYEDGLARNSGWACGDFDGDQDFTSADLVSAFIDGGYEKQRGPILA